MDNLRKYITSSFNYLTDCDSKIVYENNKLGLLNPGTYKVYVSPIQLGNVIRKTVTYFNLLEKALKEWEKATNGLIKFELAENIYVADINVYWVKWGRKYAGLQFFETFFGKSRRCVNIGVINNSGICSDKQVYHLLLHEFGHVLGLGHSPGDNDIMSNGKSEWVCELSKDDYFVTNLLYSLSKDATYRTHKSYIEEEIKKYKNNPPKHKTGNLLEDLDSIAFINKYSLHTKFYFSQMSMPMYAKTALG